MEESMNLDQMISAVQIQQVPDVCNFWMIRCKGGAFYDEYIREGFVAIGWNALRQSDFGTETTEDQRKQAIMASYPEEKRPAGCVSKCNRFINEMKAGDIVLVVGYRQVAFCLAGDYYEVADAACTVEKELEVNAQIRAGVQKGIEIACPYFKRRKITVLSQVKESRMNPHLYRAVTNRHSICSLNEYAEEILSNCFDVYAYKGKTVITFHIDSDAAVDGMRFAQFLLYSGKLLSNNGFVRCTTRINVNSPGEVMFVLGELTQFVGEVIEWAEAHWFGLFIAFSVAFGGELPFKDGTITIPSLLGAVKSFSERGHKKTMQQLEEEQARANLEKTRAETNNILADTVLKKAETLVKLEEAENLSDRQLEAASIIQRALGVLPGDSSDMAGLTEQDIQDLKAAVQELKVREPQMKVVEFPSVETTSTENHTDGSTES